MENEMNKNPGLNGLRPILSVRDVQASIDYYLDMLEFTLSWAWDDDTNQPYRPGDLGHPSFAQISSGLGVQIMLCEQNQGHPGTWLHLDVDSRSELESIANKWQHNGATIRKSLTDYPWGNVELLVEDLDQHVLRVSAPIHSG